MRRLEDPFLHRLDDRHRACQRNERYSGAFDQRRNRHGGAGGGAADQHVDLVILDQTFAKTVRLAGVRAVIVKNEFQRPPKDAAFIVDLLDIELKGLQFGIAEKRGRPCDRQHRADLDRLLGSVGLHREAETENRGHCQFRKSVHVTIPPFDCCR